MSELSAAGVASTNRRHWSARDFSVGGWARIWIVSIVIIFFVSLSDESARHTAYIVQQASYRSDVAERRCEDKWTATCRSEMSKAWDEGYRSKRDISLAKATVTACFGAWVLAIIGFTAEWVLCGFFPSMNREKVSVVPVSVLSFAAGFGIVAGLSI